MTLLQAFQDFEKHGFVNILLADIREKCKNVKHAQENDKDLFVDQETSLIIEQSGKVYTL